MPMLVTEIAIILAVNALLMIALGYWVLYCIRSLATTLVNKIQELDQNLAEAIQLVQPGEIEGQNPLFGVLAQIFQEKMKQDPIPDSPRDITGKFISENS